MKLRNNASLSKLRTSKDEELIEDNSFDTCCHVDKNTDIHGLYTNTLTGSFVGIQIHEYEM